MVEGEWLGLRPGRGKLGLEHRKFDEKFRPGLPVFLNLPVEILNLGKQILGRLVEGINSLLLLLEDVKVYLLGCLPVGGSPASLSFLALARSASASTVSR